MGTIHEDTYLSFDCFVSFSNCCILKKVKQWNVMTYEIHEVQASNMCNIKAVLLVGEPICQFANLWVWSISAKFCDTAASLSFLWWSFSQWPTSSKVTARLKPQSTHCANFCLHTLLRFSSKCPLKSNFSRQF